MKRLLLASAVALGLLAWIYPLSPSQVLIFTATTGYHHASIDAAVDAIGAVAKQHDISTTATNDPAMISEEILQAYQAVVFLNTSGDVLNYQQQADLERFIQAGGGFVGIHSAINTESDWGWYGQMIGARYASHPVQPSNVQTAKLTRVDGAHIATRHLPATWEQTDEWMSFKDMSDAIQVLLTIDEKSFVGTGTNRAQPVSWYQEFDGGRVFYTAGGHTEESYRDDAFLQHIGGGLDYAVGLGKKPDYSKARTKRVPEENRFSQVMLVENLDEPTELELLPDGSILFTQRKGELMHHNPATGQTELVDKIEVNTTFEDGLMGMALDPNYAQNNWIYLYYSVPGDDPKQRLSRFELIDARLIRSSEKMMLEVRTQRDECCHTGGSIEFGPDGNLFLSTGDNTNPFASDGFGPFDERPGRSPWDAQGSSANTNDLRGKILRIRPQPDGTYTIPEGNLFPPGMELTRPEIYVMGNRNPYRINIDQKTGYLYWGEVGPDAGNDNPERGPRGHDEVNQARAAGFFGWPLFVGDNKAYRDYDFETKVSGPLHDASAPVNDSPNNTGLTNLPPAQKAFIWYPYADSPEFPIVGSGGRNAMAGPVFHADMFKEGAHTYPDYFDGKLFIYDWIRGWINVVTMDAQGNLVNIDPFMPSTRFRNPIDMMFDDEGVMYLLEYGTGWFSQNPDARLSRIEYNGANRKPVAVAEANKLAGAAPLTVRFSAANSTDYDNDELSYTWRIMEEQAAFASTPEAVYTFEKPGVYHPVVAVRDPAGGVSKARLEIRVGNEPPAVNLAIQGNHSFYWDNQSIDYQVSVMDREDGSLNSDPPIRQDEVIVQMDYLEEGYDKTLIAQGHQQSSTAAGAMVGKRLIDDSDCAACHQLDRASIGPSFEQVAKKYTAADQEQEEVKSYLVEKIIQGGGGVWGEQAMAAHPQLTAEDAASMVTYILSVADEQQAIVSLPVAGAFKTDAHLKAREKEGMYFFRASYTDRGAAEASSLTGQSLIVLRHPRVEAESFDHANRVAIQSGAGRAPTYVSDIYAGSHIGFNDIDLSGISTLTFNLKKEDGHVAGGVIELVLDTPEGTLVGSVEVAPGSEDDPVIVTMPVSQVDGRHDLFIRFSSTNDTGHPLFLLDWMRFGMEGM